MSKCHGLMIKGYKKQMGVISVESNSLGRCEFKVKPQSAYHIIYRDTGETSDHCHLTQLHHIVLSNDLTKHLPSYIFTKSLISFIKISQQLVNNIFMGWVLFYSANVVYPKLFFFLIGKH